MKNYDAYIFDFDYTLADATDPVVDSFTYALEEEFKKGNSPRYNKYNRNTNRGVIYNFDWWWFRRGYRFI